jgi:hypothetical protein
LAEQQTTSCHNTTTGDRTYVYYFRLLRRI